MKLKFWLIIGICFLLIGGVFALTMYYLPDFVPQVGDIFHYEMIDGEFVEQHIRDGEFIGNRTIPIIN